MSSWQEALRRLNLKEASVRSYTSTGLGFDSWLRFSRNTSLDQLIEGDIETAKALVLDYVRSYLGGTPSQNRGVIGHISRIFSACGKRLPFKELVDS